MFGGDKCFEKGIKLSLVPFLFFERFNLAILKYMKTLCTVYAICRRPRYIPAYAQQEQFFDSITKLTRSFLVSLFCLQHFVTIQID